MKRALYGICLLLLLAVLFLFGWGAYEGGVSMGTILGVTLPVAIVLWALYLPQVFKSHKEEE